MLKSEYGKSTLYAQEKEKSNERLVLSEEQKQDIRQITLGIEEVEEIVRELAVPDVIRTLENGHPLNRIISDEDGDVSGYIACEDFIPHEAYIKYFGTTKSTGKNLFREIPAFLEYAKTQGYTGLNFHDWNARLNRILERYGFERIRTDDMGGMSADFFEKKLVDQKSPEQVEREQIAAFEQKYLAKINQEYQKTLGTFSEQERAGKERLMNDTFNTLAERLKAVEREAAQGEDEKPFVFGERQKAVLKLKIARHFQNNDAVDANVLYDAIIESPKFISTDKGSLHRLFEVHEEKTLIKIAEIRKRKAEQTGEGFNPWENFFTTKSGKYYVARLLNMPHLEEESEYMDHCVGTSTSYINQMKRGEIEILSFRNVPTIDRKNNRLNNDDGPIMTIEYNFRTGVIEQMKKHSDEYLTSDDSL